MTSLSIGLVKRVVGGVGARKTILRQLLDGAQTGLVLRSAIARGVSKPVDEVSDAMLYFNLQHLENHGLIERVRYGKEKAARLLPCFVQSVRRFLEVETPIAYLGAVSDEPRVLTVIPRRLRAETPYRPVKFHYFIEDRLRHRLSGVTPDQEFHEVPSSIYNSELEQMYSLAVNLGEQLIQEYAILVDVTGASRVCALALYRLAIEFDLSCVFITELGPSYWLRE